MPLLIGYTPASILPGDLSYRLTGESLDDDDWNNEDLYYGLVSPLCDNIPIRVRLDNNGNPLIGIEVKIDPQVITPDDLQTILVILNKLANVLNLPEDKRQIKLLTF